MLENDGGTTRGRHLCQRLWQRLDGRMPAGEAVSGERGQRNLESHLLAGFRGVEIVGNSTETGY
jgi:hypothetical protein